MKICNARKLWHPFCLTALIGLLSVAASRESDAEEVSRTSDSNQTTVTSNVSSTTVQVAEPLTLELTVTASTGSQVDFPSVGKSLGSFDVTTQTDRADVPSAGDSNQRVWTRRLTLESIVTGDLEIPALEILVRKNADSQTLRSDVIPVRVTSVLEDRADPTQFRDIQSVVDVAVPQPASRAWLWWTLSGSGAVAAATLLFMAVAKRKTWMTPNAWAIRELEDLRNSDALKSIDSDTVTENLAIILRDYLELQFDIAAPVRTSGELLLEIETARYMNAETTKGFAELFANSDLARFAGLKLTQAELTRAIDDAQRLIETASHESHLPSIEDGVRNQ